MRHNAPQPVSLYSRGLESELVPLVAVATSVTMAITSALGCDQTMLLRVATSISLALCVYALLSIRFGMTARSFLRFFMGAAICTTATCIAKVATGFGVVQPAGEQQASDLVAVAISAALLVILLLRDTQPEEPFELTFNPGELSCGRWSMPLETSAATKCQNAERKQVAATVEHPAPLEAPFDERPNGTTTFGRNEPVGVPVNEQPRVTVGSHPQSQIQPQLPIFETERLAPRRVHVKDEPLDDDFVLPIPPSAAPVVPAATVAEDEQPTLPPIFVFSASPLKKVPTEVVKTPLAPVVVLAGGRIAQQDSHGRWRDASTGRFVARALVEAHHHTPQKRGADVAEIGTPPPLEYSPPAKQKRTEMEVPPALTALKIAPAPTTRKRIERESPVLECSPRKFYKGGQFLPGGGRAPRGGCYYP